MRTGAKRIRAAVWNRGDDLTAPSAAPAEPAASLTLHLAGRLGRVAAACLVISNFLLLFAPLFWLTNLGGTPAFAPGEDQGRAILAVATDPGFLLQIADLLQVIGAVILAAVFLLLLLGVVRGRGRQPLEAVALGFSTFLLALVLVPVLLIAQAHARGAVGSIDEVAATGGWSVASAILLGLSLAYMAFGMRVDGAVRPRPRTSFRWPVYAAVNLLGAAVIAAFFEGAAEGSPNFDAFTLGLVLKVTLVPMLGVLAYRDLYDRFPTWARVAAAETPRATPAPATVSPPPPPEAPPPPRPHAAGAVPASLAPEASPIPPPPTTELPPPPPPDD